MSKFRPLARKSGIVVQEFGRETLIYDLEINKAFKLNETSAMIWNLSDGEKTVSEIAGGLTRKFRSAVAENFVWLALDQLRKNNLVESEIEMPSFFAGISRRDAVKRIGLASIIALPFVSSLAAPNASLAASSVICTNPTATTGRDNGCVCSAATQCASRCCGNIGGSNACTAPGLDPSGAPCRAGCECASGSCNGVTDQCR